MKKRLQKRGPFRLIASREVYKNPWIRVREDRVIRPDGTRGIFGVTEIGEGTSTIAIDRKGFCYLTKEFGYAQGKVSLGLPSGAIDKDKGESALQAAKRELLEETGLASKKWHALGSVRFYDTLLKTREHLFMALDVEKVAPQSGDDVGLVHVVRMPLTRAVSMALKGKMEGAEDIVAIVRAWHYIKKSKS